MDRDEKEKSNNLALIREMFEKFIGCYQENYLLEEYLTIDEILDAFKGRYKFLQYTTKRAAKYVLKV